MHHKRFVLCSAAAVLAIAIACSKSSESPVSPTVGGNPAADAGPGGATLKATAPMPVPPINNAQPDSLTLTATKAEGKFDKTIPSGLSVPDHHELGLGASACTQTVAPDAGLHRFVRAVLRAGIRSAAHLDCSRPQR